MVCVTGLSPQIVTETIYALACTQKTPWVPDAVYLLTTERGAENARLMLLSQTPGWFHRLRAEWDLPPIAFEDSHIKVLQNASGEPLEDIRDDADNQCAADGIADFIRQLSSDEGCEIHASIAGGRKTMGFFLGYAMSLWGRAQDRLSHVLVSAPFESRAEFFYPARTSTVLPARDKSQDPLDAARARVWLGDIPFVRLRALLPAAVLQHNTPLTQAVLAANRALNQVHLELDWPGKCVRINDQEIHLPPMQLFLMALLVWRRLHSELLFAPKRNDADLAWKKVVLTDIGRMLGTSMHLPDGLLYRLECQNLSFAESFSQNLSRLEKRLNESGALPVGGLIERVRTSEKSRRRGYQLKVPVSQIRIIGPEVRAEE